MEYLGLVRFETADGHPVGERFYAKHPLLRPFQIALGGQWYEQNRCDNGTWVYRAKGNAGTMADDPSLLVPAEPEIAPAVITDPATIEAALVDTVPARGREPA